MNVFAVLAKQPRLGFVKSRLAAVIGVEAATAFAATSLDVVLTRWHDQGDARRLVIAPPEAVAEIRWVGDADRTAPCWPVMPQSDGDLGQRMRAVFADAFAEGADRVVLIGSDSPDLPRTHLDAAWAALERGTIVFGPADDGGYYLIGMTRLVEMALTDLPWSQPNLLAETLARLKTTDEQVVLLDPWYDVDHIDDLIRLNETLASWSGEPIPTTHGKTRLESAAIAQLRQIVKSAIEGNQEGASGSPQRTDCSDSIGPRDSKDEAT